MTHHELQLEPPTAKGLVRRTPWGWHAHCACGWSNPEPLRGTNKTERRAYYRHRQAVDQLPVERRKQPTLPLFDSGDPTLGEQLSEMLR